MLRLPTLLSLLLLCIAPAWSATPESSATLFQVTVPAGGNVLAAQRQGLVTVLQRLTGGAIDVTRPAVAQAVDQVGSLVRSVEQGADGLRVDFDPEGVKRLVALGMVPYWEQPRPALLFWVVDAQLPVPLIPGDSSTTWPQLFSREGAVWAIPALFPLLDLDDLTLISTDVVTQGLMPPLLKASQRYGDELLIVRGRLSQQGEQWQLQWHLHAGAGKGEALINGQSQGTAEAVVSQTLSAISHYLADRYGKILPLPPVVPAAVSGAQVTSAAVATGAILPTSAATAAVSASGTATLQVDNVKSVDDLLALQGLLRQLTVVTQSNVSSMTGDTVIFTLSLNTDANGFFAALQDQQRLVPADVNNRFHMQWRQP
jgi:hypothetical protein